MKLKLNGIWEAAFEKNDGELCYLNEIHLPATTEQEELGEEGTEKTSLYLGRKRPVCGAVWYRRRIVIPKEWQGKYVRLTLERSKFTKVWMDENFIGESYETLIAQKFELGKLEAGEHEIAIRVDNDLAKYECFPDSFYNGHQYTEHTQTNWNGILGEMYLECHEGIFIERALVHRQENNMKVHIETGLQADIEVFPVRMQIGIYEADTERLVFKQEKVVKNQETDFLIPNEVLQEWSEFSQPLYKTIICLKNEKGEMLCKPHSILTGRRKIEAVKNEIRMNGKRISLRGSLDCAIYPLTGACPFSVEEWEAILGKMKEFGMNHYRFHSWCPPEAAFTAADRLGIYLQAELSCFANELYQKGDTQYDSVLENYLYDQAKKILETFGNHPSFVLFAVGNEMRGDSKAYNELLKSLKQVRTDILYSQGSNNFLEDPLVCEEDQFWVTMRTSPDKNIRASFSHNDLPLGSIQSKEMLGTLPTYEEEAAVSSIPLIAHEIGQYQSFPKLQDKEKYTGVLRADVYSILEEKLKEKGLLEKNEKFYRASGALLVQCYKAEIEANLRTKNMSGFQLLGLQDFTGQGTALVGVLDGFLENKDFIQAEEFKHFCNDVVVMAELPKYCYTVGEEIAVGICVYNYSGEDKTETLTVSLIVEDEEITSLCCETVKVNQQCVEKVMEGILTAQKIDKPCAAKLRLVYGAYENEYDLWLYPKQDIASLPENRKKGVWVTNILDTKAEDCLRSGGNVLLCNSKAGEGIEGFFPTDFWCYPMFRDACIKTGNPVAPGTMGLLIDKSHPALKLFPTNSYSGWQWQQIVSYGTGVILEGEEECNIIVQVIDNFDRNHVLGLVYEKKIGEGRLVVCASDLLEHLDIPEMRQLYISLLNYCKELLE
ncbi:glycoside hydrolase family 2 TIM barrel-domain containing protein [Konateibacter massiliensis]|uniref:glycoside hydrolase family 2 TIM barrel-domain containing protein n=1 Tax=Konateibacter massiliensis TaxID=2002841 RepID=UPI0015D4A29B|nr:glycoside hydrolase family 2 TIM barrel-domain containing protein [Konateibacter massiliensis]